MSIPPWLESSCQHFYRMALAGRMPHAVMLLGPDGLGKRGLSRWLSRLVLCDSPAELGACGQCRNCQLQDAGTHPDYFVCEPAAGKKQIGVDQIRELISGSSLTGSGHRVFVIVPAEALNPNSANALLKTLEEPTPGTLLILVAQMRSALPATILSRCHVHPLTRPSADQAVDWLSKDLQVSRPEAASALATAEGRIDLAREILQGAEGLDQVAQDLARAAEGQVDLSEMAARWADESLDARLSIMSALLTRSAWMAAGVRSAGDTGDGNGSGLERLTAGMDLATLTDCYRQVNRCRSRLKGSLRPELQVEELLLNWQDRCHPALVE